MLDLKKGRLETVINEVLNNLYASPSIILLNKSRRMRWATCNMHGGHEKCVQNFSQKYKGKCHSGDQGVDERMDLRAVLRDCKYVGCIHLAQDRVQLLLL
jgi:hypothetical protein